MRSDLWLPLKHKPHVFSITTFAPATNTTEHDMNSLQKLRKIHLSNTQTYYSEDFQRKSWQ